MFLKPHLKLKSLCNHDIAKGFKITTLKIVIMLHSNNMTIYRTQNRCFNQ